VTGPSSAIARKPSAVDDYEALAAHAKRNGIAIGTVNANVFQDDDHKLGSICNPDPRVGKKALAHLLECVDIMDAAWPRGSRQCTKGWDRTSGCCLSTSCSSRRSTRPTCPTGAPACCTARSSARRRWWSSTPANAVLMDAYNTDVRPMLAELRQEMGLAPDPVGSYLASGYGEKNISERRGGSAAGWGA
jgi:L-rhamnose isomerase